VTTHRTLHWLTATLVLLLVAGIAPHGSGAAFRGANGKIVIRSNRDGNAEIYSMNADGSNRIDLTRNPSEDVDPRWSPDGSQIVFASNRGGDFAIYIMNADGSNVRLVTSAVPNAHRPTMTADGKIVFQSGFFPNRALYIVAVDGSGLTRLTPLDSDNAYAAAAPHNDRIAFSRFQGDTQSLYVMKENGTGVQPLTTPGSQNSDVQANWSPNSNDVVFAHGDSNNGADLYIVHANGTGLRQLTNTPGRVDLEPAWSPDGTKITFHGCTDAGGPNQHCAVYTINPDGTGETEISTPHAPFVETFSSDLRDPIWHTIQFGTDTSFAQQNGRLEITLGADAQPGGPFNTIEAHYGLNCSLPGDFDMQVDYQLLDWPAGNGAFAQLAAFFIGAGIFRQSETYGEFYNAYSNFGFNTVLTADRSGSFRFVRSGGRTIASYLDPLVGWVTVLDVPANPGVVVPGLSLSSGPNFAHEEVRVAFDNFRVNSGTLSCPTWWDDSSPDWQPTIQQ
jgi:dipeptidyl aminopeptidase/acylaminoacyl peptidase